jgi:polysaccharide export outer membrane protein
MTVIEGDVSVRKRLAVLLLLAVPGAICQQRPESRAPAASVVRAQDDASGSGAPQPTQTLAINDQLVVFASDIEGIGDRSFRVETDGTVMLPLVGRVRALGLTVEQFEKELIGQLGVYVRSPNVSVKRLTARADTIVAAGAFRNPGVHTLTERRTLFDVLSTVGGLESGAARTIKITRRIEGGRSQLPSAVEDRETGVSTATVNMSRLSTRDDIIIEPNDVLFAGPAGVVFLTGEVMRPGSFELAERESFGMTELISLAGGLSRDAAPDKTKILRPILNGTRRAEIPVDVKNILAGGLADFPVLPNDMVVVPRSRGKAQVFLRPVVTYVVPAVSMVLVYRFFLRRTGDR